MNNIIESFAQHFENARKLVSGDHVLTIYYLIILIIFIGEFWLDRNKDRLKDDNRLFFKVELRKLYEIYYRHGFFLVILILYAICIVLTIQSVGVDIDYLITITISYVIFAVIMKIFLRIFVDEDSTDNQLFKRYINIVFYLLLGNFFCYFMPFVRPPYLLVSYIGLLVSIACCVRIMVRAILNPEILRRREEGRTTFAKALGILKGMLGVVISMVATEYMMVLSCFVTDPGFYETGAGRVLNFYDMFYYTIISFTTIGYGDIYPIRFEGMFYSELTAILIGLSSMFTSACFVAAVVSTANSIAESGENNNSENNSK